MRPSIHDTSQPHHVVRREDEYGRTEEYCACGNHLADGYYHIRYEPDGVRLVHLLHDHVRDSFDGRCHFKRYGMECGRYYGHRGLHREVPKPRPFSELRARLLAQSRHDEELRPPPW